MDNSSIIVHTQYDCNAFPLHKYTLQGIPNPLMGIMRDLSDYGLAIYRGGLAFIFITGDTSYKLKDLDMMAEGRNKDQILQALVQTMPNHIFLNSNRKGEQVITSFWKNTNGYFKLDILLSGQPLISQCITFLGTHVNCVQPSFLWMDRILKIAEKDSRKHSADKTLNHFRVAHSLSSYLLHHSKDIRAEHVAQVRQKLPQALNILAKLAEVDKLNAFNVDIQQILHMHQP